MKDEQEADIFPDYDEYDVDAKIPAKYKALLEADSFEKFRKNDDWWD